jgi:predicted bacteriocin transport accessory protein
MDSMAEEKTATTVQTAQCAAGACEIPQKALTPEEELSNAREVAYEDEVTELTAITVADVQAKIDRQEKFVVLFSRKNCPWCQIMLPSLILAQKATGREVYYVNTINTPTDKVLKAFRDDHDIQYVPTFLAFANGQLQAKYDGDRSVADLSQFLQEH